MLRTFSQVFPNTTLWDEERFAIAMPDGSKIDEALIRERFNDPKVSAALKESGYANADAFLQSFTMGPEDIQKFLGSGPILTDDHPYIEYGTLPSTDALPPLPKQDVTPYLRHLKPIHSVQRLLVI